MAISKQLGTLSLDISVDTTSIDKGTKKAKRALKSTDEALKKNAKTWGGWQKAIVSAGAAFSAAAIGSNLVKYSDAATSINNKLKLATKSTEQLDRVTRELFKTANETGSSVEATVELYAKMERATRDLGVSEERLLKITGSINKAFTISGATTAEAAGSIKQLGQALASGVLRGDEFNSIAEQAPIIMEAIQKATGKTTGELRKLAEQGAITSDIVVKSLERYKEVIDNEHSTATKTFAQNLEIAKNSAIEFVGSNDLISDAVGAAGGAVVVLSENIDVLAKVIAIAGTALTMRMIAPMVTAAATALSYNIAMVIATRGTVGLTAAIGNSVKALGFLGGPITGILGIAALSLATFVDWETKAEKQTRLTNEQINKQTDALKNLSKEDLGKKAIEAQFKLMKLRDELETLEATMKRTSGNMGAMGFGSNNFKKAEEKAAKLREEIRALQEISNKIGNTKDGLFKKTEETEQKTEDPLAIGGGGTDIQVERAHKKRDAILLAADETLAGLRQSFADELTLEDDFYLAQQEKLALATQAKRDAGQGGALFEIEAKNLELQLLATHEDEKTRIENEAADERMRKAKEEQLSKINNVKMGATALLAVASAFGSKSEKQQKRLRRAQVIVDTAAGVMNAFATAGNIYTAIGLSAMVVAQGKKSLDAINSGRAVSGGRTFAPAAATPPQQAQQGQGVSGPDRAITINLTGDASSLFSTEQVRNLIEKINEQVGDGVQLGIAGA